LLPKNSYAAPLFASAIFMLSAGWHGMTLNFLLWGGINAFFYSTYIILFSKFKWPSLASTIFMPMVLLISRMIYVDVDIDRLLLKFSNLFSVHAWSNDFYNISAIIYQLDASKRSVLAIIFAISFLVAEYWSLKKFASIPYKIHRMKIPMALMLLSLVLFTHDAGTGFVYARF
jgi:hypothetical protein